MRQTPATVAAIVALLEPLISAVLALTFLGERLSPTGVLGGALLLGSILYLYVRQPSAESSQS
jgi:drug/metabolite transporter (DMT)-like permease